MSQFNPLFWEVPTDISILDRVPASSALWFEDEIDQAHRHAIKEFFEDVAPAVKELIHSRLTRRQREVVELYFYYGKTQEDIAVILNLSQSTVSRHLFGTARGGKKVGGAIPKLRKAIDTGADPRILQALDYLQSRILQAA